MPQIKKRLYLHSQNGITPWSTCFSTAEIAQLVEHNLAPRGIKTSPTLARDCKTERALHNAEIAQLVEHNLAKVGVASSSLVFRSKSDGWLNANHFYFLQTDSHERPQVAPYQGVRGCQQKFARNAIAQRGLESRFIRHLWCIV